MAPAMKPGGESPGADDRGPRLAIDEARARRRYRDARFVAADDFVQREVSRRLAERLDAIRHEPTRVVDVGCGRGADLPALAARFATAEIVGTDASLPRLEA